MKVAQKWFHKKNDRFEHLYKNAYECGRFDFDTFTKMPKNVEDLGKLIFAEGFQSCPKSNKSPNLVTLHSCTILTSTYGFTY